LGRLCLAVIIALPVVTPKELKNFANRKRLIRHSEVVILTLVVSGWPNGLSSSSPNTLCALLWQKNHSHQMLSQRHACSRLPSGPLHTGLGRSQIGIIGFATWVEDTSKGQLLKYLFYVSSFVFWLYYLLKRSHYFPSSQRSKSTSSATLILTVVIVRVTKHRTSLLTKVLAKGNGG
jgi:hypothetical protein